MTDQSITALTFRADGGAQHDFMSNELPAETSVLQLDDTSTDARRVLQIVSTLVAGAVAAFDADRETSRRYLLDARAILRTCAPQETANARRGGSQSRLAQWQLQRVLDYIEQNLADRITGNDLADLIDLSIGQFFRAFKASVGVPPLHYVASRRLEFACSLLRNTREPLSQIALTAGFCDQSHFCRVFGRVLGVTPSAWRRVNKPDPKPGVGRRRDSVPVQRLRDIYTAAEERVRCARGSSAV